LEFKNKTFNKKGTTKNHKTVVLMSHHKGSSLNVGTKNHGRTKRAGIMKGQFYSIISKGTNQNTNLRHWKNSSST
jgi:hypothetical protein